MTNLAPCANESGVPGQVAPDDAVTAVSIAPETAAADPASVNRAGHRDAPVSWVRRGVRVTSGQEKAWEQFGPAYLIEPPRGLARESIDPTWRWDPAASFGRHAPLVVEIGTGQGENIVAAAAGDPNRDYLGVEVYKPGLARTIVRAQREASHCDLAALTNLRLIQANAPELLATALPAASIAELWLFFPDPWPKARHRKRRLVSPGFVDLAARTLEPGGTVRLATDWADYAVAMRTVFAQHDAFEPVATDRFEGRVLTAFERKGRNADRAVIDLAYRRRCN